MATTGMTRVLALLRGQGTPQAAADAAAAVLGVSGLSGCVLASALGPEPAWGKGISGELEDLQFTLGEGPGVDAAVHGMLILEPDLASVSAARWPGFTAAAAGLGVTAVFAFPLRVEAVRVGAMLAWRDKRGPLTAGQLADGLAFADAVTALLLEGPAAASRARQGMIFPAYRAEVHQAAGMISVQLSVSPADALIQLRAHAFASGRPVAAVAADVVARRLRFGQQPGG